MDIKNKIEEVIGKIKSDKNLKAKFVKEPVKTIEDLLGVDLPDEQVKQAVKVIKAKIEESGIDDKLESLGDKLEDKLDDLLGRK